MPGPQPHISSKTQCSIHDQHRAHHGNGKLQYRTHFSAAEPSTLTRSNNESDSFWSPSLLEVRNATTTTIALSHGSQNSRACSLRLLRCSQTILSPFSKIFSIGTFEKSSDIGITKLGEKKHPTVYSIYSVVDNSYIILDTLWTQFPPTRLLSC